ncbi:HlyD family efflux transporter periplasmic adaptor subunit [Candidatus Synechococcus calcipolaris G9]|uniref:HlyD family efflux transporter periplasmic adaptor subunit n=1 Tax=Candidatus Synechococcus calcipolaris G9 TaxID=1497997 RepID=A0ABT6F057_9SYNE|nr:HlyD family efflux transporter periplasmic adaptor subunit [Candidatus Synechococcus calcipolaris]MDG2991201.1 HlyD family efflux transporter periplasmic adaptor subunit [Candidatus Synechococcus calcipolaris G9]
MKTQKLDSLPMSSPKNLPTSSTTQERLEPNSVEPQRVRVKRSVAANLVVVAASIGVLAFTADFFHRHLTVVRSRDAVVNGVLVTLRAPENGTIVDLITRVGDFIDPEDGPLAVIENDRASEETPQTIESEIARQRGELAAAQAKLQQLQGVLASAQGDAENQRNLEIIESNLQVAAAQAELQSARAKLEDAQARQRLATINNKRFSSLAAQGVVSQAQADAALTELQQSQAQVRSQQRIVDSLARKVEALKTEVKAAQRGLTLRNTRSNYDPRLRLQELQMQIGAQEAVIAGIEEAIAAQQTRLLQAEKELQQQQTSLVDSPVSGVVWEANARNGMFIQQGEPIMQVLDCDRRWVDVFVDEKYIKLLAPGTKATIELYGGGNRQHFRGTVSHIRSGLGRLTPGEAQALPIPENYPRQSQIRVEFDPGESVNKNAFCYVGYTGQVTFDIRR